MYLKEKIARFMHGRNGFDKLCYAMLIVHIILFSINFFVQSYIVQIISLLLLIYMSFRFFSKNIYKRQKENLMYEIAWKSVKPNLKIVSMRMKDIKTHRYRKCTNCNAMLRLPKRTGKHFVICPRCRKQFEVKIRL